MLRALALVLALVTVGPSNAACPSGYTATCPSGFSVSSTVEPETISATNLEGCVWFCKCDTCFGCTTTDASTNEVLSNVDIVTRVDARNNAGGASNLNTYLETFYGSRYDDAKDASCAHSEKKKMKKKATRSTRLGEAGPNGGFDMSSGAFGGGPPPPMNQGGGTSPPPPVPPSQYIDSLLRGLSEAAFASQMYDVYTADVAKVTEWGDYAYTTLNHENALTASRLADLETAIQTSLGSDHHVSVTSKFHPGTWHQYAEVSVCSNRALYKYNILVTTHTSATASGQPLLFSRVAAQLDGCDRKLLDTIQTGQNRNCNTGTYETTTVDGATMTSGAFVDQRMIPDWNDDLAAVEPHVRGAISDMRFDIINA